MSIYAVSDIELEEYETFSDEKIDSSDEKVQNISNQLPLCHSNRPLEALSNRVHLGNQKTTSTLSVGHIKRINPHLSNQEAQMERRLYEENQKTFMSRPSVEVDVNIEKNKNDNPKGDISVIYESHSEDGKGTATVITKIDSEGNINAKITIKKDF